MTMDSLRTKPRMSPYVIVALTLNSLSALAQDSTTILTYNNSNLKQKGPSSASNEATANIICQKFGNEISCQPRRGMRALTQNEVETLLGAKPIANIDSSSSTWSTGGCNAVSCTVTGHQTSFSSSLPPAAADSQAPSKNPAATNVPTLQQRDHYVKCAQAYGTTRQNPNYHMDWTTAWGWSSHNSQGIVLKHILTDTPNEPRTAPPAGGSEWLIINATTFSDPSAEGGLHTEFYMNLYTAPPETIVESIVHEWYHQDNDTSTETPAQQAANEQAAYAAGEAAKSAYLKDNGAKCAG